MSLLSYNMQGKNTLLGIVASSGILAGCSTNDLIVEDFSSIYKKENYSNIQKQIYASEKSEFSPRLINQIENFYDCSEDEATNFANSQKNVYVNYLEFKKNGKKILENKKEFEKNPNLEIWGMLMNDVKENVHLEIELEEALEKLKIISIELDNSSKKFYESLTIKILNRI